MAPDLQKCEEVRDRIGEWAQAQWYAAQGYRVMSGSAVGIQGTAMVIVGDPRCGASSLAYCLSQNGWGLISDGLVIADDEGTVLATESAVRLDLNSVISHPSDEAFSRLKTGRERIRIETTGHTAARIGHYVFLGVNRQAANLSLTRVAFDDNTARALDSHRIHSHLKPIKDVADVAVASVWLLTRPLTEDALGSFGPQMMSSTLLTAFTTANL